MICLPASSLEEDNLRELDRSFSYRAMLTGFGDVRLKQAAPQRLVTRRMNAGS